MRSFSVVVLFLSALGAPLFAQDGLDELANSPELAFEADQSGALITFDRFGGLRVPPPKDWKPTPFLTVLPDGTIRSGSDRPGVVPREGKLTREQLYQLLDFVVKQNEFYEADTASIKADMENAGDRIMIADALTSKFTVNLKRGSHTVEVYALMFNAEQYSGIPVLQRLLAIEKRLQLEYARVQIGNDAAVQKVLDAVNQELKKKRPDMKPFQRQDIIYAQRKLNGDLTANLMSGIVDKKTQKWKTQVNANYGKKTGDAEPTVGLYIRDGK